MLASIGNSYLQPTCLVLVKPSIMKYAIKVSVDTMYTGNYITYDHRFNYLANLVPCKEGQKTLPPPSPGSLLLSDSLHLYASVLNGSGPGRGVCLGDVRG